MLSIHYIRENTQKVKDAAKNKNRNVDIDKLLQLDEERKVLIQQAQEIREERNIVSKQPFSENVKQKGREIKEKLKSVEEKLTLVQADFDDLMLYVPNVPLDEVPIGSDETGNVVIRTLGKKPSFDFKPKSHIDLMRDLDMVDFEHGSKISGYRGYFLKNDGAMLHLAVLMYAFQKLVSKGYTPIIAPSLVKIFTLFGSAHFPWGKTEDVYGLNDEDAFLSATGEIPTTAFYSGEILNEKDLPKKFVAISPCFRREAGSHGKDTKGLYRVHEFWKIEQVILGKNDLNDAKSLHDELQANTEEIVQDFGLHYQVLLMCTGDMGEPQLIKYDTEAWMPGRDSFGEVGSNSIMGDFQARRLNLRYRDKSGEVHYCYTLNNTAVASPRMLIPIVECNQQKDGSVNVPKVLQPFVGKEVIEKK